MTFYFLLCLLTDYQKTQGPLTASKRQCFPSNKTQHNISLSRQFKGQRFSVGVDPNPHPTNDRLPRRLPKTPMFPSSPKNQKTKRLDLLFCPSHRNTIPRDTKCLCIIRKDRELPLWFLSRISEWGRESACDQVTGERSWKVCWCYESFSGCGQAHKDDNYLKTIKSQNGLTGGILVKNFHVSC